MLANSNPHTAPPTLHPLNPLLLPPLNHPSIPGIRHLSFAGEEKHFVSGNHCCCSLSTGFLPSRSTLFTLLSLFSALLTPSPLLRPDVLGPSVSASIPRLERGRGGTRGRRWQMTESERSSQRPQIRQSSLSKMAPIFSWNDKQEFLFALDVNAQCWVTVMQGKDPRTLVLALPTIEDPEPPVFEVYFSFDGSPAFVDTNGFPKSFCAKAKREKRWSFPWEDECLLLFSPSEALISRIINPDLCNPIGTLCSLHQRGPTRPEIHQRLISQSGFHPFGKPSIPWPRGGESVFGELIDWLIRSLPLWFPREPYSFTGHPRGDFVTRISYFHLDVLSFMYSSDVSRLFWFSRNVFCLLQLVA